MLPFHFGTPQQFVAVRALLAAHYTVDAVRERTGSPTIYDFRTLRDGRPGSRDVADALDVLIRLFMDAEAVAREDAATRLPPGAIHALESLALLRAHPADDAAYAATVLLYPTQSLHIASDLEYEPAPDDAGALRSDAVYPAITRSTQNFLNMLPATPCDAFLDLCAGTGIAAFIASRHARHACAVDVTERCTAFARFNALLNGLDNVTTLQGDLYAPVAGRTFDRIVAHPPYMPAAEQTYIFRDGGEDGEQITRRILAGLADHLSPGGSFYCTTVSTDRKGAPVEQRLREMLGAREADFDLVLVTTEGHAPADHYATLAARGRVSIAEAKERIQLYRQLEAERIVGCSMVIRRHAADRPAITARRQSGAASGSAELEWLLHWETAAADPAFTRQILAARPRISPFARLNLVHHAYERAWVPEACTVVTEYPFPITVDASIHATGFLAGCDGTATVREHLHRLKESAAVPATTTDDDFAGLVRSLVAGGILEMDAFRLPAAAAS